MKRLCWFFVNLFLQYLKSSLPSKDKLKFLIRVNRIRLQFFFCAFDGQLYFITNRHNVIDQNDWFYPDELRLKLHIDENDLTRNRIFSIPLYDDDDKPAWFEHQKGKDIDVVALPVNVPSHFFIMSFNKENFMRVGVHVSIGNDLIVVGYPLGFYDSRHNTPIIRSATIASVYPLPFEGEDCFLIDSRLHKGTSGSPVILKPQEYLIGHRLSPPLSSKPFSVDMWVKGLTIINSDYSFQSLCYS